MIIKALTLWEFWASAMVTPCQAEDGTWHMLKQIETRGPAFPAVSYRGPIAIHAGRHWDEEIQDLLLHQWPFSTVFTPETKMAIIRGETRGKVLGIGWLDRVRVVDAGLHGYVQERRAYALERWIPCEYHFGNFAIGRKLLFVTDMHPLEEPIPASGKQGLWNWEVPARLEELVQAMIAAHQQAPSVAPEPVGTGAAR